jgi:DNA-binding MarR family transcriptional regulator
VSPKTRSTPIDSTATRAHEAVRALARASRVLERASSELSLAHYRVLSAIASGDERTVSAAVEALCQRGLLVRSGVEGDQRVAALRLTGDGEALLERVEAEMVSRIDALCARTPDGAQLMESLVWLGDAIDEVVAERWGRQAGGGR